MQRPFMILLIASSAMVLQGCGGGVSLFGEDRAPGAPVQAGSGKPAAPDAFAAYDRDANGVVTKSEMEEAIAAQFRKDDLSGDGHLDSSEVRTVNDRLLADSGSTPVIDWNADGKVILAEYASQWRTLFERSDVNSDGIVDEKERAGRARQRKAPPLPKPEFGGYKGKSIVPAS